MNKIERASIGRYAFNVDIDAYKKIKDYLNSLSAHYGPQPGGSEIMEGIEERMAELLIEECGPDTVVTEKAASKVIAILGEPEAIDDEAGEESDAQTSENSAKSTARNGGKRKFYRDCDHSILGGVCAGLAHLTNIDVTLMRVLWLAVMIGGSSFARLIEKDLSFSFNFFIVLAYLVLWVITPKADTVRKKYEMHGESLAVDDIANSISNSAADHNNSVMHTIGRVGMIFFGSTLLLTALCIIGVITTVCVTKTLAFPELFGGLQKCLTNLAPAFANNATYVVLISLAAVDIVIPLIGMIYGSIVMIFDINTPKWKPGLCLFLLWIICLIATMTFAAVLAISTL
ncbi:MAG: PspC domain-containing protein [Bacteroidales bacterium]|nr:PspC domain-containing protein [Bacteroidales bacterium]